MSMLHTASQLAGDLGCILTLLVLLLKPLRQQLFADREAREGQKCLLRQQLVATYYRNLEQKRLRQYEFESITLCYRAYKALGGNSFAQHIYEEMQGWTVVP